jgi:hypothetical protein
MGWNMMQGINKPWKCLLLSKYQVPNSLPYIFHVLALKFMFLRS